jgi:hypothetical protein
MTVKVGARIGRSVFLCVFATENSEEMMAGELTLYVPFSPEYFAWMFAILVPFIVYWVGKMFTSTFTGYGGDLSQVEWDDFYASFHSTWDDGFSDDDNLFDCEEV